MKRRRVLSAIGGVFASTAVGAAKRGPPPRSGPPAEPYTGPMISAHEHLYFMPAETLDDLVDWMDALDWERMVGFSTAPLLERYEEYPSRFIPFDQGAFSRWALGGLFGGSMPDLPLPYLPAPDDSLTLETLSAEYAASLEDRREWAGIGEISLRLVHQVTGRTAASLPDAAWLGDVCAVAADHDVTVMLHPPHPAQLDASELDQPPAEAITDGLSTLFDDFPSTRFLVHGVSTNMLDVVNPLLEAHDNWVYDVSGIMFGHPVYWGGVNVGPDQWDNRQQDIVDHFTPDDHEGNDPFERHIDLAWEKWKPILTQHPERVLWGIDSGRPWHYFEDYFEIHDRLYRGLLGRLPEADARTIGHVNARRYL